MTWERPADRPVPELIVEAARARPDAVAVRQWDERLRYRDLVAGASTLAGRLREGGAGPEALVGICLPRLPSLLTGVLGVLLSGSGYVPLDPSLPRARLRTIADEARLHAVVTVDSTVDIENAADLGVPVVPLPAAVPGAEVATCGAHPDGIAYAMFTSGSTGRPKGVVVPHRALTGFVTGLIAQAGLGPDSTSIGFASVGFDVSVIDLLVPLVAGGTVALATDADRADPLRLQRFCAEHRCTFGDLPPAMLPLLDPDRLPDLALLLTGSEAPGPEQVQRWSGAGRRFVNCYGPTETTVQVTSYEATGRWDTPLPIGRPTAAHRAYVVDADLRPVAVNEPGELLIGGPGLARGYLGQPASTADRFVPDPFSGRPGERLYRTGDLVTRQADGELRFLGRADGQVKVRGQRVEPGEVEAVLRGHPAVSHASVAPVPGTDGLTLVAFVTTRSTTTPEAVRAHCADRLPAAMVPGRVVLVPELPKLSTGKVDLRALVDRLGPNGAGEPDRPWHPPSTARQRELAAIWAELLGRDRVGRDDDFFDSGGHSITAMRLVAAVRARLHRELAIEDVLSGRTLDVIAARIEAAPPVGTDPAPRGRPPALSPAQQRLWFLDRVAPESSAAYNIAFAERLRGPLDVTGLAAALAAVAGRQEVLRWRIPDSDGVPYAVVDPPGPVPLPVEDVSTERALRDRLAATARQRFDLATDRLWRAHLFRLGPEHHVLAVVAHHAVFDGWSQALFYDDLAAAYRLPRALPALLAGYADYVAYRAQRQDRRAAADLAWWVSHLDGAPATVELPADRPRPAEQTFAGGYLAGTLDRQVTAALAELARQAGATPPAVLLAALGIVLARLTGQHDLVVGSPTVDRRHADFEEMVGFFIDIAPLRLRVRPQASFHEHVRLARDELLAALAHPEPALDRIVQAFGQGGQVRHNPLVQVLFNMFTFTAPRLELAGLSSEPVPVDVPGSPFDLTVYGVERDGLLHVELVYNTDLYDESRMLALLEGLRELVTHGVASPDTTAAALAGPQWTSVSTPRALLRPAAAHPPVLVHPATATERAVAAVWCDVLGRDAVGATDSFFDVGGASLTLVAVQHRLTRLFGRELRVVDLLRHPTVRALAGHLDGTDTQAEDPLERAARRGAARRGRTARRAPSP